MVRIPEADAKQPSERDHQSITSFLNHNNQQVNELQERMIQCLHTISTYKTHDIEAEDESTMHNQEGNTQQSTVDNPEVHSRQSTSWRQASVRKLEADAKHPSERDHQSITSYLSHTCNNQQVNELHACMVQFLHKKATDKDI